MIKFRVSPADAELIDKIVDRAMALYEKAEVEYDALDCRMDLTACHANGTPLDLARLLAFDDFNFGHDIAGIRQHLDRTTGKLDHRFMPRCIR